MSRTSFFNTGQGSVSQLAFVPLVGDLITSGSDGSLVRWTQTGYRRIVTQVDQPIVAFAIAPGSDSTVFATLDGTLWRTTDSGAPLELRRRPVRVMRITVNSNRPVVYVGYADGEVISINTRTWEQHKILQGRDAVRQIAMSHSGNALAVVTDDGMIHVREAALHTNHDKPWVEWPALARHIVISDTGLLIAACTNGIVWIYSLAQQTWLCLHTGSINLTYSVLTDSERKAIIGDSNGRLIELDLDVAYQLLSPSQSKQNGTHQYFQWWLRRNRASAGLGSWQRQAFVSAGERRLACCD